MTIESVGRVIYNNDDDFDGATPEPAPIALIVPGLCALLDMRRKAS